MLVSLHMWGVAALRYMVGWEPGWDARLARDLSLLQNFEPSETERPASADGLDD